MTYSKTFNLSHESDFRASQNLRYNKHVFILPPWEEIYKTDDERKMQFKHLNNFHDSLYENYLKLGYELIEVPKASVTERCQFMKEQIKILKG